MFDKILCIAGPTASGKSALAVDKALARNDSNEFPFVGEIISVDSRQVYRGLNIGTEKITHEEMRGVPHHLIDIREINESYSAGDFVSDTKKLIKEISARGKLPILVGGTHFYFDAFLNGLPAEVGANSSLRKELEKFDTGELFARVALRDPRRASELNPKNRRRLVRALEIIEAKGIVPARAPLAPEYKIEWIVINPSMEELRERINIRLEKAFRNGLIDEVLAVREKFGDDRLSELGLEYKIVGEFLRGERSEESLRPTLSSKLWQYARRQKAWLRKLLS